MVHTDGPAGYDDTARKTRRASRHAIAEERLVTARASAMYTQATFRNSRRHCLPRRGCKREYIRKGTDQVSVSAVTVERGSKRNTSKKGSKTKREN